MKSLVFILIGLVSTLASAADAKTLSMYCHDQYYSPIAKSWMTGIGTQRTVSLQKDPSYPNPNEPRAIWKGEHTEQLSGATVLVKIDASELDGKIVGYNNTISISRDGILAESDGGSYLRASFRLESGDQNGIGIICHEMTIK